MCSRHAEQGAGHPDEPLFPGEFRVRGWDRFWDRLEKGLSSDGADSAQALADAIEYVEAHGLTVTSKREAVLIIPRCIACELPAEAGDIYCKGHARLAYDHATDESRWAANE